MTDIETSRQVDKFKKKKRKKKEKEKKSHYRDTMEQSPF